MAQIWLLETKESQASFAELGLDSEPGCARMRRIPEYANQDAQHARTSVWSTDNTTPGPRVMRAVSNQTRIATG
jgi:hypothetical protein